MRLPRAIALPLAALALLLTLAACGVGAGTTPTSTAPAGSDDSDANEQAQTTLPSTVTVDGVTYVAETRFKKSNPDAHVSPGTVRPWVTLTNTNESPVEVPFDGCAVHWRLYEDEARTGDPVWEYGAARDAIKAPTTSRWDPANRTRRPTPGTPP